MRCVVKVAGPAFAVAWFALAFGCTEPKSARCRAICAREAECVETTKREGETFEEKECVAACGALENDTATVQLVQAHASCVKTAADCAAVLNCR